MNGLLKKSPVPEQMPGQAPAAEGGQPDQQQGEQAVYTKLVEMALGFAYSEDGQQMVAEGLKMGGSEITQNIGNVVAKLLNRIIISVNTAGKSLPAKMTFQIAMEITSAVVEMAEAMGLTDNRPGVAKESFFAAMTIAGRELPEEMMSQDERAEIRTLLEHVSQLGQQQAQPPGNPQQTGEVAA